MNAPSRRHRHRRVPLAGLLAGAGAVVLGLSPAALAQGGASSSTSKASSTTAKVSSTTTAVSSTVRPTVASTVAPTSAPPTSTLAGTGAAGTPVTTPAVTGRVAFPAQVVAPMLLAADDPARQVNDLYVTPGATPSATEMVVRFAQPFDLPKVPYRVSVVLGKPDGDRVRASLTTNGGPKPEGKVEKWDGKAYTWISTTQTSFDRSGLATIGIPVDIAPSGVVWAEVELRGDVTVTPAFPQSALVGQPTGGKLAPSPYARVVRADGTVEPTFVAAGALPELSFVNKGATLTTADRPPTEVGGRRVTHVVDIVPFATDFSRGGLVADEVRVDRTEGTVSLLRRRVQPPEDRSRAEGWLVQGLPEGDPGAPGTVVFSLPEAAAATGANLGPDTALGVRRELTLDDGATVIADALLATTAWFDDGAVSAASEPPTTMSVPKGPMVAAEDATAPERTALYVIGGAVLALVALSTVVLLRRRRHLAPPKAVRSPAKAPAKRRRHGDAADVLQDMAEDMDELRRTGQIAAITGPGEAGEEPTRPMRSIRPAPADGDDDFFAPVTGQQPVVVLTGEVPAVTVGAAVPAGDMAAPAGDLAAGDMAIVTREDLEARRAADKDEAECEGESAGEPRPRRSGVAKRVPVADPLAMLGDVDDLSARLQRLGGDQPPPPPPDA